MKVIAIKHGYYGTFRQPGDEFEVDPPLSASWYEPVEQEPAAKATKSKKAE